MEVRDMNNKRLTGFILKFFGQRSSRSYFRIGNSLFPFDRIRGVVSLQDDGIEILLCENRRMIIKMPEEVERFMNEFCAWLDGK
jgi:hypothetical protein